MNRNEKRLEIKKLDEQIKEYEDNIFELEEAYKETKLYYESIVKDNYEPIKAYDMTSLKIYGESIYQGAEEHRKEIVAGIEQGLNDTVAFMSDILVIIKNIQKAKRECEDKKAAIEATLDISIL